MTVLVEDPDLPAGGQKDDPLASRTDYLLFLT